MTIENYTLTARLHGAKATRTIEANTDLTVGLDSIPEQEALDFDATIGAVKTVLDLAYTDELWAQGAIELARPDGTVIHTMEAKS